LCLAFAWPWPWLWPWPWPWLARPMSWSRPVPSLLNGHRDVPSNKGPRGIPVRIHYPPKFKQQPGGPYIGILGQDLPRKRAETQLKPPEMEGSWAGRAKTRPKGRDTKLPGGSPTPGVGGKKGFTGGEGHLS